MLISAPSQEELDRRLAAFASAAAAVGLTYTVDACGQRIPFLGMILDWAEGTFAFSPKFMDKVLAATPSAPAPALEDLQFWAGLANWACHLSRTPL